MRPMDHGGWWVAMAPGAGVPGPWLGRAGSSRFGRDLGAGARSRAGREGCVDNIRPFQVVITMRVVRMLETRGNENSGVILEYIDGSVSVVNIKVENGNSGDFCMSQCSGSTGIRDHTDSICEWGKAVVSIHVLYVAASGKTALTRAAPRGGCPP